jgi:hypothetical protein
VISFTPRDSTSACTKLHFLLKKRFDDNLDPSILYKRPDSTESLIQISGAFLTKETQKLEFPLEIRSKVKSLSIFLIVVQYEKFQRKRMKRYHWECKQEIEKKLSYPLISYSFNVDQDRINFRRLRPLIYLLFKYVTLFFPRLTK